MTQRQRTPIEGITRRANEAQLDSILTLLRRLRVATDADSGNVTFTLGDKEGATAFRVEDSAHVPQLDLDSDGNLAVETIVAGGPEWILGEFVETAATFAQKEADYTVTSGDETIEYISGSYTLTLLDGEDVPGKVYNIKNSGSGTITIATLGGRTIDGNASGVLTLSQYDNLTVQSNGRNYIILDLWASAAATPPTYGNTEIDFGATPVAEATFTIVDAACTTSSDVIAQVMYSAPTGKDLDELEMDRLYFMCTPGTGQFTLYAAAIDGSYLEGTFKISYTIG